MSNDLRYSCDCRGLMRVNELSALINSVSKLILQAGRGLAQIPKRPEYSLMRVSPVSSSMGRGVVNVNDPSPLGVQPSEVPRYRERSPHDWHCPGKRLRRPLRSPCR
jgi:hypothetical protein